MFFLVRSLVLLLPILAAAQHGRTIVGTIQDGQTGQPLPFASISLKDNTTGTISNESGAFRFYMPHSSGADTLIVHYLGYTTVRYAVGPADTVLSISLAPYTNEIAEITVSPMSAADYLTRINEHIRDNYAETAFSTNAYYREIVQENGKNIANSEAIIHSYYAGKRQDGANQHRIVLYRQAHDLQKPQFLDGWLLRLMQKQEEHTIAAASQDAVPDNAIDFGGPQTILSFDLSENEQRFLATDQQDRYTYRLEEITSWQGCKMRKIYFETTKQVDHTRHSGYMWVDMQSYAVGMVQSAGTYVVPIALQPVLLLAGLRITEPSYVLRVSYQKVGDRWYPKDFHGIISLDIEKRNLFSANQTAHIEIQQLFFVNELLQDNTSPIAPELQYDANRNMASQVYNDGTDWNSINVLTRP